MKFLVIGLGSMGKRRIRNLKSNGQNEIFGFDVREDRRKEVEEKYNISTFDSLNKILKSFNIDAFIISVPPDKHIEYVNIALDNNIHCFIEASVTDEGMLDIIERSKVKTDVKICPSCTLRFHPSVKLIKNIISSDMIGKVSNFSYHSGQYLPDWHPWEKISDYYVSNKKTGGCREIVPFELTWLNCIFGKLKKVCGFNSKTIELGVDIDDVYASVLEYENNILGTLLVDVVSRVAIRKLVINGDNGQIQWDWNKRVVDLYSAKENRWIHYDEPEGKAELGYNQNIIEEMYIEEIEHFINSIEKKKEFPNNLKEDYDILQALYQIEQSNGR